MNKPSLTIIAGFPGTGKTTVSKILSRELGIPRLETDFIAREIKKMPEIPIKEIPGLPKTHYSIAYKLIYALTEDFLNNGQGLILDMSMCHKETWKNIAKIKGARKKIFILDCPYETSIERVDRRYRAGPQGHMSKAQAEERKHQYDFIKTKRGKDITVIDSTQDIIKIVSEIKKILCN